MESSRSASTFFTSVDNKVPRMIYGVKKVEVSGQFRLLHIEKLRDLYRSPNIVRVVKCRMDWTCSSDWGD